LWCINEGEHCTGMADLNQTRPWLKLYTPYRWAFQAPGTPTVIPELSHVTFPTSLTQADGSHVSMALHACSSTNESMHTTYIHHRCGLLEGDFHPTKRDSIPPLIAFLSIRSSHLTGLYGARKKDGKKERN